MSSCLLTWRSAALDCAAVLHARPVLNMGGEFVSVMNTWQDANNVFDRVLDESYGPFASPTDPGEAAAILAESRLMGQLLAANDAPREQMRFDSTRAVRCL